MANYQKFGKKMPGLSAGYSNLQQYNLPSFIFTKPCPTIILTKFGMGNPSLYFKINCQECKN